LGGGAIAPFLAAVLLLCRACCASSPDSSSEPDDADDAAPWPARWRAGRRGLAVMRLEDMVAVTDVGACGGGEGMEETLGLS
jgi:hypothetical protein